MRKFVLLAHVISVGAFGNRVIEDKNPHDESEFENVDELVRKGFLEEVKDSELEKAELEKAELEKAELEKAELEKAELEKAELEITPDAKNTESKKK